MPTDSLVTSFTETRELGVADATPRGPRWAQHPGQALGQRYAIRLWPAGGEPIEIRPGEVVYAGRHPCNDLILRHMSTSRFQAVIEWTPEAERPTIRDRGSNNGTYLDGQRLDGAPVTLHGDEQLVFGKLAIGLELLYDGFEAPALLAGDDALVLFSDVGSGFTDYAWDGATLQRSLLSLEDRRRTGAFRIESDGFRAQLTFCLGRIVAAESPTESEPEAVVARVLECRQGSYDFSRAFEPVEASLDLSVTEILQLDKEETRRYPKLGYGESEEALQDEQLLMASEVGMVELVEETLESACGLAEDFEFDFSEPAVAVDWGFAEATIRALEAADEVKAGESELPFDEFVIDLGDLDLSADQIWGAS